jgi:transcriptional regulator with XRE-family HTH domain
MAQETLGELIRRLRREKKLTQKELGEKINASDTYVSKIETGNQLPSYTKLGLISQVLQIPWQDMVATGEIQIPNMYKSDGVSDDDIFFSALDKAYVQYPPKTKLILYEIAGILEKYV